MCKNVWLSGSSRNIPVPHLSSWIQVCHTFAIVTFEKFPLVTCSTVRHFSVLNELLLPTNSLVGLSWTSTTTARRLFNTGGLPVTKGNVPASQSRYRWKTKLLLLPWLFCFSPRVSFFPWFYIFLRGVNVILGLSCKGVFSRGCFFYFQMCLFFPGCAYFSPELSIISPWVFFSSVLS